MPGAGGAIDLVEAAIDALVVVGPAGEAEDPQAKKAELMEDYTAKFSTPYVAAARGMVDDVIEPADTRRHLIGALNSLRGKKQNLPPKKHGNMPL